VIGGLGFLLSFSSFAQVDSVAKSGRKPRLSLKKPNRVTGKSPFSIYGKKPNVTYSFESDPKLVIQKDATGTAELTDFGTFNQKQNQEVNRSFWRSYSKSLDGSSNLKSRGLFPKIELPPAIDRIFGGTEVSFKPNGSLLLDVGYMGQFVDNPAIPVQLRYVGNLYFNEQAQINFQGKIGDKLNMNVNFDTKASFNFQNQLKLNWKTQEEDILQNIEVGNTSWTLNSQLIPGIQNL
jgi:cell surface protein SprA